jgi:hypothetical protein
MSPPALEAFPMTESVARCVHGSHEGHLVPKYLYLDSPGSRWQLADDVDIVELRRRLTETGFGNMQTEVLVDGVREPLIIRRDQVATHAVVDTPAVRPIRHR